MMKIMIVDDEVIIRTGLATVIKWDELGLTFLEPAASAGSDGTNSSRAA